jgi:Leucine-rich repeat (LRR) protein
MRWTIRTLLIAVTLLALLLAWIGRTVRAVQHRASLANALENGSPEELPVSWSGWDSIRRSDFTPDWPAIFLGDWSSVELTDVDVSYRQTVNDELLQQISVFQKLDEVSVHGQAVTDRSFAAIRGMPDLKTVNIEACDITDTAMEHLATLPNLEDLTLRGVGVTDKGLAHLWKLPKLTSLTIEFTQITPEAIKTFQDSRPDCVVGFVPVGGKREMEAAKGIMRRDANILYDADTRLVTALIFSMDEKPWRPQDWALLSAIPEIQAVSIDGLDSATEGVRQVQKLPNVERLVLESMPVTPSDFDQLAAYPKLVDLEYKPEDLSDAQLAAIGKLTNLRKLKIEADAGMVTRRGIAALAQLKQLKHLQLSSVAFVDDDLEPLAGLESLTVLDLSSTPVTDGALDHLLQLPKVNELILNETQISGAGAQRIMKSPRIQTAHWSDTGIKPEFFVRPTPIRDQP